MATLASEPAYEGRAGRLLQPLALGLLGAVPIVGLAAANGYFSPAWGWATLALLWPTALGVILVRDLRPPPWAIAATVIALLYSSLTAASSIWASGEGRSLAATELSLIYASSLAAATVLARRHWRSLLHGVLLGLAIVAAYGLATRLFPAHFNVFDPVAGYRLAEPLGYTNSLGAACALGIVIALGAADGRGRSLAAAASGLVPLFVLAIYFTFSRGAWVATGVAVLAMFAVRGDRLRMVATALITGAPAAVAVFLASRIPTLTRRDANPLEAAQQGRWLALAVVFLVAGAAALSLLRHPVERRLSLDHLGRRVVGVAIGLLALVALVVALARVGTPVDAYRTFASAPPAATTTDLNSRLFSINGSGRIDFWKAAVDDWRAHPGLGSGAGTYEIWWNAHRPTNFKVRNAHSLYLETLAELGPLGLVLIASLVLLPLVAGLRCARRDPLLAGAWAAFLAFALHAGVDWDWQIPALTAAAFLTAGGLLAARGEGRPWRLPVRGLALVVALAVGGFAFVGLIGNNAIAASADAARSGDWQRAASQARKATRWLPWSAQAWQKRGEADFGLGAADAATASLRAAISRDPENWELWLELATMTTGTARADALDRAHLLNPRSIEIAALRTGTAPS